MSAIVKAFAISIIEPFGIQIKLMALSGVVKTGETEWFGLLLGSIILISLLMVTSGLLISKKELIALINPSGALVSSRSNWVKVDLNTKSHDSFFYIPTNYGLGIPLAASQVKESQPRLERPRAFLNMFSNSIILLPNGYGGPIQRLTPAKRFVLFHEIGHATSIGSMRWGMKLAEPIVWFLTLLILVTSEGLNNSVFNLIAIMVLISFTTSISGLPRRVLAESVADCYAFLRLAEQNLTDAKSVIQNEIRAINLIEKKEKAKELDYNFEYFLRVHRKTDLNRFLRYTERVQSGKLALRPNPISMFNLIVWNYVPGLILFIFFEPSSCSQIFLCIWGYVLTVGILILVIFRNILKTEVKNFSSIALATYYDKTRDDK